MEIETKVTIKCGEKTLELTGDEARNLWFELDKLYGTTLHYWLPDDRVKRYIDPTIGPNVSTTKDWSSAEITIT